MRYLPSALYIFRHKTQFRLFLQKEVHLPIAPQSCILGLPSPPSPTCTGMGKDSPPFRAQAAYKTPVAYSVIKHFGYFMGIGGAVSVGKVSATLFRIPWYPTGLCNHHQNRKERLTSNRPRKHASPIPRINSKGMGCRARQPTWMQRDTGATERHREILSWTQERMGCLAHPSSQGKGETCPSFTVNLHHLPTQPQALWLTTSLTLERSLCEYRWPPKIWLIWKALPTCTPTKLWFCGCVVLWVLQDDGP